MTETIQKAHAERGVGHLVLFAAWAGLVCGLVEGAGLLLLQRLDWLNWNMEQLAVSAEIIWISPLIDLLLFLIVGLMGAVAARLLPRLPIPSAVVGLLALMVFFDWLALSGRIRHSAALALGLGLAAVFVRWYAKRTERVHAFWRRSLPWVAAAALLAALGIEGSKWLAERRALAALPSAGAGAPNILVIIVDTLRADHLSAHGYERPTSPRMDAFAREGVLFESAIATSSWTLPSHVSLVTGRYPYEHPADHLLASERVPTVAETFRSRGYRTGAFSANTVFFTSQRGFSRGFIRFEDFFHSWTDRAARTLYGRKIEQFVLRGLGYDDIPGRKSARDVTDAAVRWIGRDHRPFLAYLNYFDAHDPYLPPQPWRDKFAFPGRPNPGGILNSFLLRYYPEMTPEQWQDEIAAYDGAIAYTDHEIGRLLDELDRRGLARNTIVVITSDHGEMLGEHELNLHRNCLYREVIHVPLMVRWPERIPAGRRVTQPVSIASIPATLAQLAGASSDSPFPGPSLAPLWQSPIPPSEWPEPLAELEKFPFEEVKREPAYHGAMKSLVSPQWHYIEHEKFGQELFDWTNDQAQATNLAATPEGKPVADRFAERLKQRLARARPAGPSQSARTP